MTESARISKITGRRKVEREPAYSDFLTNFNIHPETGMLMRNTNAEAVKRGIRNLILTDRGERMYNPSFGCDVRKMLFENFSPQTSEMIKTYIEDAIETHEPRVNLIRVLVRPVEDRNLYSIAIVYELINLEEQQTLALTLERIR